MRPGPEREVVGVASSAGSPGTSPLKVRTSPRGTVLLRSVRVGLDVLRGTRALGDFLGADAADVATLCAAAGDASSSPVPALEGALFLDTETTGLRGGAGTYVFLLGTASVVDGALEVRQALLAGPGDEEAFLDSLDEEASCARLVVTFHGRGFDLPRLEERCLLAGRRFPLAGVPHVDLLLGARRVLRWRAGRTGLQHLERTVLGVGRTDDLPGRECPEAWLAFVRGDASRIDRVLEHNLLDLLSLPPLLAAIAEAARGAAPAPDVHLAGRVLARAGSEDRALGLQRTASRTAGEGSLAARAHEEAARLLRRRGETAEAAAEAYAATLADPGLPGPWIALAKHAEHGTGDLALALECARRAEKCLFLRGRGTAQRRDAAARVARLERKVTAGPR